MDYDLIVAGGGVAGAALAFRVAQSGARVLVVERETTFRDRVRGENIHPWGVVEAVRLGLAEVLRGPSFRAVRAWQLNVAGAPLFERDLSQTPAGEAAIDAHHPELQEALLAAAERAGAQVMRAAVVTRVERGRPAIAQVRVGGAQRSLSARLVVAADGRESPLRSAAGSTSYQALSPLLTTGCLVGEHAGPEAQLSLFYPPEFCAVALWVPLPARRARIYLVRRRDAAGERFSGDAAKPAFFAACGALGMPSSWLASAQLQGPLATFDTTLSESESAALPGGLALVGDAAGTVDPAYGCGLSLALMDARSLAERLLESQDWDAAAARYALDRRRYAASLRAVESWMTRLLYTPGPAAGELRARALPRLGALRIDLIGAGPASPTDRETEQALFA